MNLDTLLTPAEQTIIRRRAWAHHHLTLAAQQQWRDPCTTNDRALAMYVTLARRHGLTETEIAETIHTTRKEETA